MITSETQTPGLQPEISKTTRSKKQAAAAHLRKTFALASRVRVQVDGSRQFVRFGQTEILEHWVLLISFFALAATGLVELAAGLNFVARITNSLLGGVSTLRTIHQVAAVTLIALSIFHALRILYIWIVKREPGALLPRIKDAHDLMAAIRFNLGRAIARPQFGRFTIEEKIGYWAFCVFAVIMILTGLALWFPTVATWLLPGLVIPVSRTMHKLTAILAILAVLTWHLYYTIIKQRNSSIFTGLMDQQAMQDGHPLEFDEILAAYEEVKNLSKEN